MGCCQTSTSAFDQSFGPPTDPRVPATNPQQPASQSGGAKGVPKKKVSKHIDFEKLEKQRAEEIRKMTLFILENFEICKIMKKKLSTVAHTSNQVRQLAQLIMLLVQQIEEQEKHSEKELAAKILEVAMEMNDQVEIFYHKATEVFQMFINKEVNKEVKTKPESLSRIYYSIANFKKDQKIDETGIMKTMAEKNVTQLISQSFWYRDSTRWWRTNGYCKLTPEETEQVVKLEGIGEKVEQVGARMRMKFKSITKDSENMTRLLAECLCPNSKVFNQLKYDLNHAELMKIGEISRNACNYHENGVILLLIYMVRACTKLEKEGAMVGKIEEKMQAAIELVHQKYPPGEGLTKEQKDLEKALKDLEYKEKGEEKFSHEPEKFTGESKQTQLENIIKNYATIAKKNRNDFEDLIQETCFSLAIHTKVGLKLNPDSPSDKAIIRIKEKMLFKGKELDKKFKATIQQTLQAEEEYYKSSIDEILRQQKNITFTISDMVRAKCVFLEINDIILTVQQIKNFVQKDDRKRFKIIEIESRFTRPIPISDVTLKIVINNQIVAQLQLTIQANAATYSFSHKIYQLQRTKVFSKLKIVHNYYSEFGRDFKELTSKAMGLIERETGKLSKQQIQNLQNILKEQDQTKLGQPEKMEMTPKLMSQLINQHCHSIEQYVDLSKTDVKEFEETMMEVISHQEKYIPPLKISTDKYCQFMMVPLFNMEMGDWYHELGQQINTVLESKELSNILKATLIYFFFKKFSLSKELIPMQHFWGTYYQIAEKKGYKRYDWQKGKDYMEIFLQEMFKIQHPFDFANYTAKSYYKTMQAKSISIQRIAQNQPCRLGIYQLVRGVVAEETAPEVVGTFMEYLLSYFLAIEEQPNQMTPFFEQYYRWLISLLDSNQDFDFGLIKCQAEFLFVQLLLKYFEYQTAQKMLLQISKQFKKKEEQQKWLECCLLMAQCQVYEAKDFNEFNSFYRKQVEQNSKAVGLELRGKAVANSEWRIYQQLWKKWKEHPTQEQKNKIEQTHLRKALTESSRSEGKQFVEKMIIAANQGHDIFKLCTVIPNENVRYIYFEQKSDNSQKRCEILGKATKWKNLNTLNLNGNSIDAEGCAHLQSANWPSLTTLDLGNNSIGNEGCAHLQSANWPSLTILNLDGNSIGTEGCAHLQSANWLSLTTLSLKNNNISSQQQKYRQHWEQEFKNKWPKCYIGI